MKNALVVRHVIIFGYTDLSLQRASSTFICQSTPRCVPLTSVDHADTIAEVAEVYGAHRHTVDGWIAGAEAGRSHSRELGFLAHVVSTGRKSTMFVARRRPRPWLPAATWPWVVRLIPHGAASV